MRRVSISFRRRFISDAALAVAEFLLQTLDLHARGLVLVVKLALHRIVEHKLPLVLEGCEFVVELAIFAFEVALGHIDEQLLVLCLRGTGGAAGTHGEEHQAADKKCQHYGGGNEQGTHGPLRTARRRVVGICLFHDYAELHLQK